MKHVLPMVFIVICLLCTGIAQAEYEVGDTVSDFTLSDRWGSDVNLSDFQGDVIFLVFWGSL